jgi:5'-3' exoribonuclease 2
VWFNVKEQLFRWLSRKYPSIVVNCTEEKAKTINGIKVDVDATQPNPNEVEFDNLYLNNNPSMLSP